MEKKIESLTWDDAQVMTQRPGNDKMSLVLKDFSNSSKPFGEKERKERKDIAALMGG